MPETSYDPDPEITARAIYRYIARHGLHTAREELARWDLAPRITHNQNGSIDLTAFHDQHGTAAITYHRAVNGEISLKAASPNQRLPKWLQPARSYRPDPRRQRKPRRGDAPKLPLLHHISTDHDQFTLVLSCTNLIHILERQLALRVATAAAAVASDYLPNRAIKYAFHPRATPFSSTMPHDPMHAAKYAALNAILEAIPSEPGRLLAEKHLTEPDWFLLDLLVSTKPVRRHSLKREHISRTPEKTNRLNSVHTLPRRRPQDTGPVAAAAQLNTDLVTELLDPEATETLLALSGQSHQPRHARITQSTIPEYNTVRSSLAAYAPLAETEPGLARLYMTSRSEMSQKVPDPETLIDRLRRKNCRDNDAKWKHFRRIANIPELRNTNGYYIALAAEAAATADRDDAPDRSLIALCQCGHIIDDNKRFESRHGSKTIPRRLASNVARLPGPGHSHTHLRPAGNGLARHVRPPETEYPLGTRHLAPADETGRPLVPPDAGRPRPRPRRRRLVRHQSTSALGQARTRPLPAHTPEQLPARRRRPPSPRIPRERQHAGYQQRANPGLHRHRPGPAARRHPALIEDPLLGGRRDPRPQRAKTKQRNAPSGPRAGRCPPETRPTSAPATAGGLTPPNIPPRPLPRRARAPVRGSGPSLRRDIRQGAPVQRGRPLRQLNADKPTVVTPYGPVANRRAPEPA